MSEHSTNLAVRKIAFLVEDMLLDTGLPIADKPRRVIGLAVFRNPCVDEAEDGAFLSKVAPDLSDLLMPRMLELLGTAVTGYGKAAILGTMGHMNQAAALLHPTLGKPIRAAIGGGAALIPSNAKVASLGATIDVPLGHRDNAWSFEDIDTITVGLADAPRADEIVLIIALSGRLNAAATRPASAPP